MKLIGLVQARMGSTRLPGKVMKKFAGKPIVWHICDRLKRVDGVDEVVLATGAGSENDCLVDWAVQEGVKFVQHPNDDDIAGRMQKAITMTNADVILKANGDCPLLDVQIASSAIKLFNMTSGCDAVTNKIRQTYPLGFSLEVLGRKCIEWCAQNLTAENDRELMVKWIFDRPEFFKIASLESEESFGHLNLTVDTPEDYEFVGRIFDSLYRDGESFGWPEVKRYLQSKQDIPACAYL